MLERLIPVLFSIPPSLETVLSIMSLLSGQSSLCLFPCTGRKFLFHMVRPVFLNISQTSTFLSMQYILLRAECFPLMALVTVPKSFDNHRTLINIVITILQMKKLKTLFTSPSGFCPISEYTQDQSNCPFVQKLFSAVILGPEGPFGIQSHALNMT